MLRQTLRKAPALVAVVLGVWSSGGCERAPAGAPAPVGPAAASAYKDPRTGRFGPPPATTTAGAPAARLSTSAAGLVETAGPRGGWMVRLQGRFQNELRATRTGGVVSAACGETP